jgi:hypothetical protein
MTDIILGIVFILVGAMFCFRGYFAMRILIPIWGFLAGFSLGAGIVAGANHEGFLRSTVGWIVGLVVGLIFFVLAYLYYAVSVAIAMGAIGFVLGVAVMTAIGVKWQWVIVLVGVAAGALLAAAAIAGDLPTVLLTVLTATSGATTIVFGLLLLVGKINANDISQSPDPTKVAHHTWWGYAIWGGIALAGMISQFTAIDRVRGSWREAWESGGR